MNIDDFLPSSFNKRRFGAPVKQDGQPFHTLQQRMNRLFEHFFTDFEMTPFEDSDSADGSFTPRITVRDEKDKLVVEAELPGMKQEDLDITLGGESLTLRGEKKTENRRESDRELYSERTFGMFERVIPLPFKAEEDKIDAKFSNGLLCISIPKPIDAQRNPLSLLRLQGNGTADTQFRGRLGRRGLFGEGKRGARWRTWWLARPAAWTARTVSRRNTCRIGRKRPKTPSSPATRFRALPWLVVRGGVEGHFRSSGEKLAPVGPAEGFGHELVEVVDEREQALA